MDTIQERRRLNEEIERAYIETIRCAKNILLYRQTERGIADIDLYSLFYEQFTLLVLMTSDLPQLRDFQAKIEPAVKWTEQNVDIDKEKALMPLCLTGVRIFKEYKKLLSDQGIVFLPAR